jgi:hypothetical protein
MMQVPTIQHIAAHMGGEDHNGRQALVPGPGHSTVDRLLSITINDAGDDVPVHSFGGDDPIKCKDFVRQKLRMDERQPNGKGRIKGHGSAQAAIDAMTKRAKAAVSPAPTPPASYHYVDVNGSVAYVVERLPPTPTDPKPFRQYRPQPGAGPIYRDVFPLRNVALFSGEAGHAGWPAHLPQISGPAVADLFANLAGFGSAGERLQPSTSFAPSSSVASSHPYLASIAATTDTTRRWRFTK